ncbi:MAG: putative signal transduction histidine kinase [Solirubrobacterales bacterium]|nr:putative signal transduction histidine kinase [Solirubrobacterales bacterium]
MAPASLPEALAPPRLTGRFVAPDASLIAFARETCEAVCGVGRLASAAFAVCRPEAGQIEIVAMHGDATDVLRGSLLDRAGAELVLRAVDAGGFAESADGMTLAAAAPAGPFRALVIGRRHEDAWGWDACLAQLLEGTTRVAGLALRDRIRIAEDERRRAERQRTELACTIHEDVVQRMFGVSLALDDAGPLDDELRGVCAAEIERALADLRAIIRRAPGDGTLRRAGLDETLDELAAEGVAVDAPCTELAADPGQQAIARSVLTEAMRNARKHASPTRVHVSVEEADGLLKLSVVNDGVHGRGRGRTSRSGVGLQLAATEAAQGGGVLEHGPEGPGRWGVRLALPLEERDEHDCHGRPH